MSRQSLINNETFEKETVYDQLGQEPGLKKLVDCFYHLMDTEVDFKILRDVHGDSLDYANHRLFCFLSGYFGGPDEYISRFGHPRLRARHLPFSIGTVERDQWVACMGRAMMDIGVPEPLQEQLLLSFFQVADHMRNRLD